MEGRLSHPYVLPGQSDVFVTVDLTGAEVAGAQRTPVNLAVVIDRSGSMSGQKLMQAKQAARHLVQQLQVNDRLAIVHYGSDVKVLPGMPAQPQNREQMLAFIDNIWDEGGTNISAGLEAARNELLPTAGGFKVNRVILISDGQPTEGRTDDHELTSLVQQIRAGGVTVSSIGVGTDFNEDLMQAFAEYGSGSYGYLRDTTQLATLFQKDLRQASTTIARGVELSFELPDGMELAEVLGYRFTQAGRTVRVPLSDFSAGQVERVVARVTVSASNAGTSLPVAGLKLAYNDVLADKQVQSAAELSATVTARAEEVTSHQDREATVQAVRAQSAQNHYKAAQLLQQGRKDEALRQLQQNEALYDQAAQSVGPAALAADRAEQKRAEQEVSGAADADEVNHQVKSLKVRALRGSGRGSSVY
jgi:Ca-activated chloride channel family protein